MNKILVIGSSGAGKTTLAKKLSAMLALPHTELDAVHHQKNWQPLDDAAFKAQVNTITDGEKWILCGNYFTKSGGVKLWGKADTVIWCDYPFPLVFSRLMRRTLKRTITKEKLWNDNTESFVVNFFSKESVLLWMIHEWKEQQQRYGTLFEKGLKGVRLVRLRNAKDTTVFLETIDT